MCSTLDPYLCTYKVLVLLWQCEPSSLRGKTPHLATRVGYPAIMAASRTVGHMQEFNPDSETVRVPRAVSDVHCRQRYRGRQVSSYTSDCRRLVSPALPKDKSYEQLVTLLKSTMFQNLSSSLNVSIFTSETTGGCHSHRLSCDHGQSFDRLSSAVWPLTALIFGHWPLTAHILPAKESRYLNCNPSPRACMSGNKRSVHV